MKRMWNRRLVARLAALVSAVAMLAAGVMGPVAAQQKDIVIGTHEAGSSHYLAGAAIADVLSKHSGMTGKLVAVSGAGVWLPMMDNREVDLGVESFHGVWQAYHGVKPFAKAYNVRLVLVGGGINVGLYVRDDSPAKSRKDIKGLRIGARYPGAPNIATYAEAELANVGLDWSNVTSVPRTSLYAGQREDVTQKRLDVFYASVGSAVTRELDSNVGIRFLGADNTPEAVARMRKVYPAMLTRVEPGAPGIKQPMWLTYLPAYLVVRTDLPDEVVYKVAKTLWEKNAELRKVDAKMKSWTTANYATDQAAIPYHSGAIRFYKEMKAWSAAAEKNQTDVTRAK
ncbi:MAG: hypothetical protein A3H32_02020 [Betaproteobacteria bacterium RIFCSPLOWO2_02_FULL_63_19]|nr:MAG: hypothetical protein A3H32_02020 [Betaproteobacteria bacterium RIFCSPLOWO2_02_FULL_63_19]